MTWPTERSRQAAALGNLSRALQHVGQYDEAINACQAAAEILRQTGDRNGE